MRLIPTFIASGTAAALLLGASVAGPTISAEPPTPTSAISIDFKTAPAQITEFWLEVPTLEAPEDAEQVSAVNTLAQMNPLAPQKADAAWWHFTVRDWGTQCGYVWLGGKRYEVERWAYGWTSDKPTCQRSGQIIVVP